MELRRLLLPLAVLVAALIVGGGLGLVLTSRETDDDLASPAGASMSVVSAGVRPPVHAFGEPIVAEVVLLADRDVVRPDTVRIRPDFSPYEPAGRVQVQRTHAGSIVRIRYRYPLHCLREGCAPEGARRTFEFALTNVVYGFESSPGPATAVIDWPQFEVTARVGDEALAGRSWRADVASLPDVSYHFGPGALAASLLGGSLAFAAAGIGIAWWLSRGRQPGAADQEWQPPALTPLERALALAREAARNGDAPERRKALERVAQELGARGLPGLAERARALAWSSGPASRGAVDDLARDADAATNGGSR